MHRHHWHLFEIDLHINAIRYDSFQFKITDKLPKYLCPDCATTLKQAFQFKEQCEFTEKRFLSSISDAKPIEFDSQLNQASYYGTQNRHPDTTNVQVVYIKIENEPCNDVKPIVVEETVVVRSIERVQKKRATKEQPQRKNSEETNVDSGRWFHCDMCTSKYKTKRTIIRHLRIRHVNKDKDRLSCSTCNKSFLREHDLHKHSSIHNTQCKVCGKAFASRANLMRHVNEIHNQLKSFTCEHCQISYGQKSTLKTHINSVHLKKIIYKCSVCDAEFYSRPVFYLHKRGHTDLSVRSGTSNETAQSAPKKRTLSDDFQCQYCGKLSSSQNTHTNHLRTHTGEKPFECQICNKSFSQHSGLLQHTRVHTGETPYRCDVCDKKFKFKIRLKEHILLHSGQRSHKCMHCDKTFTLRGNLTVHLRLHTGETPYECTICDSKFTNLNALKRHRNNGHTDEMMAVE